MKRFLFDHYTNLKAIGFDLDGTLYNEYDFVQQVYREIVRGLKLPAGEGAAVLKFMEERWLEKGSSYPYIFQETLELFPAVGEDFPAVALAIYRGFRPSLMLEPAIRQMLEQIKEEKNGLFLVTDGRERLQNNKIDALGIRELFAKIIITGAFPKPDPRHGQEVLAAFQCKPHEVLYVGDRDIDREFARNCKFHFLPAQALRGDLLGGLP